MVNAPVLQEVSKSDNKVELVKKSELKQSELSKNAYKFKENDLSDLNGAPLDGAFNLLAKKL